MASTFPLPKFNFKVKFTPGEELDFQEVSGLDIENEFVEYREGNDPDFIPRRRVSMRKSGTVSFKNGLIKGEDRIIKLYNKLIDEKGYQSDESEDLNITVSLLDEKGEPCFNWEISNAVPIKLSTESLSATDNAIAVKQIDFSHSGIKLSKA